MKTIRIRVKHINSQDIIARQLIDEIPENICPEQIDFRVLGSNIVEVTVKGYHTGTWHGKVEASFPIDLYTLQKKIGKYIIIDDPEVNHDRIIDMKNLLKAYCKVTKTLAQRFLINFADNDVIFKIAGKTGDRTMIDDEVIKMITNNGEIDWLNPITQELLLLVIPDRKDNMIREIISKTI